MKIIALREQDLEDLEILLPQLSEEDKTIVIKNMNRISKFRPDWAQKIHYFLEEPDLDKMAKKMDMKPRNNYLSINNLPFFLNLPPNLYMFDNYDVIQFHSYLTSNYIARLHLSIWYSRGNKTAKWSIYWSLYW